MNGHSDVVMGAAVTNDDDLFNRLKLIQIGIYMTLFDCETHDLFSHLTFAKFVTAFRLPSFLYIHYFFVRFSQLLATFPHRSTAIK